MWFGGMMLWMVVFWVGVVVLAVWVAGLLFPRISQGAQSSPREILDARYARGQLTREQYQEMLKEIALRRKLKMNRMVVLGAALIVLAIVGMGAFGGWGWGMPGPWMGPGNRPGPSWMPHMGWGRGPGTGAIQPPIAGAPAISVGMEDFRFVPAEIRVKAGRSVNLALTNRGGVLHDLAIPALRFHAEVTAGQQTTAGFVAPRVGVYEFYCSVPGHREAGMIGRLVIVR